MSTVLWLLHLILEVATRLKWHYQVRQNKHKKSYFLSGKSKEKQKWIKKHRKTTKLINRHNYIYSVLWLFLNTYFTQHNVTIKQVNKHIIKLKDSKSSYSLGNSTITKVSVTKVLIHCCITLVKHTVVTAIYRQWNTVIMLSIFSIISILVKC